MLHCNHKCARILILYVSGVPPLQISFVCFFNSVELKWKMSLDLLTLQQKQYISVHGKYINLDISCPPSVPTLVTHFYVMWFLESTKEHAFTLSPMIICTGYYLYCQEVASDGRSKIKYMIFGKVRPFFQSTSSYSEKSNKYSWREADVTCRMRFSGDLPYFNNRNELDEFTAMLKKSARIPFIEAVFIGLIYNQLKVG